MTPTELSGVEAVDLIDAAAKGRSSHGEQAGDQLLFLRPRRFGKSLWLSVLESYYDLARADRLRLDFSEVDPSGNTEAITASLHQHINRIDPLLHTHALVHIGLERLVCG